MPQVNDENLDRLLWWMCERQQIWRRRHLYEQPPPWTDDEILANYRFCNVHRRLDAGTQYYLDEVDELRNHDEILLNTIVYRFFNRPETMRSLGGFQSVDEWDTDLAAESLHVLNQNNPVFSPAYRVSTQDWVGADNKIDNILYGVIKNDLLNDLGGYVSRIIHADSMEESWERLQDLRGVGPFLAYELVTDLNYTVLPFTENDFVNIGPGAEQGLEYIFEDIGPHNLRWLREYQEDLFTAHDKQFPYWEEKPELTLRDFEHSACEFATYMGIKRGEQSGRSYDTDDYFQTTFFDDH